MKQSPRRPVVTPTFVTRGTVAAASAGEGANLVALYDALESVTLSRSERNFLTHIFGELSRIGVRFVDEIDEEFLLEFGFLGFNIGRDSVSFLGQILVIEPTDERWHRFGLR